MRVLIATNNPGKLREFQQLLGSDSDVVSLGDLGLDSPPEDGATFDANAEMKARIGAGASGLLTISDDSGLEVDALGGAPGVYSARFSGDDATDESNRSLLLQRLTGVPAGHRQARFVSVVAVCDIDGHCKSFRGEWDGQVAFDERGKGGFGYDSLFELSSGRTAAQLSPSEKNAVSHRAKALREAMPYVKSLIDQQQIGSAKGRS